MDEVIRIWLQKLKTSKYFKELIFNTLLFADEQFIISNTEDNLQKAVYLLYNISKEYNLEISTKKDESTGSSKKLDGIWNRYNLKSTRRIYTFGILKCSEKFEVLDLP